MILDSTSDSRLSIKLLVGELLRGIAPHEAVRRAFYERFGPEVISSTERKRQRELTVISPVRDQDPNDATRTVGVRLAAEQPDAKDTSLKYEINKHLIAAIFCDREGNIAAVQRVLEEKHGLSVNYHTLAARIKAWGLPTKRSQK